MVVFFECIAKYIEGYVEWSFETKDEAGNVTVEEELKDHLSLEGFKKVLIDALAEREGELAEPFGGSLPIRQLFGRVAVVDFGQGKIAARSHFLGASH